MSVHKWINEKFLHADYVCLDIFDNVAGSNDLVMEVKYVPNFEKDNMRKTWSFGKKDSSELVNLRRDKGYFKHEWRNKKLHIPYRKDSSGKVESEPMVWVNFTDLVKNPSDMDATANALINDDKLSRLVVTPPARDMTKTIAIMFVLFAVALVAVVGLLMYSPMLTNYLIKTVTETQPTQPPITINP